MENGAVSIFAFGGAATTNQNAHVVVACSEELLLLRLIPFGSSLAGKRDLAEYGVPVVTKLAQLLRDVPEGILGGPFWVFVALTASGITRIFDPSNDESDAPILIARKSQD